MRLSQLDPLAEAIESALAGASYQDLLETLDEETAAIVYVAANPTLKEQQLNELLPLAALAPAAMQAARMAGTWALRRGAPAAAKFLRSKMGKGAKWGGGAAAGAEVVDRAVGGNDNDDGPSFGDGFEKGFDAAGGNRRRRFGEDIKSAVAPVSEVFNNLNEITADDEERYKDNPAMLKALRQIEKTFGPERKKITDQVLAMCRAADMMTSERWADRALGQVEMYGIKSKEELVQELELMIQNEKQVDDEDITDTGSNIRQMERALSKLQGLNEGALAGHYRVLRRAKAEGKTKEEAHKIAKARGAHPNTVEDVYRDEIKEARSKQVHDFPWPYEEMEQQAYNVIRHDMHAYDAFDHLFSMAKDQYRRDWLLDNKEEIIKMFAGYGLTMEYDESVTESDDKPYICVHAKKGKYECHAKTSYEAAKKAAAHWKMKSTAGIDAHLAVNEGWEELPPMPSKYIERDGLEGPIMTRSGKVVYYDPKAGDYYDPDTDMYISYDDFRMLDKKGMHMTGKVDEIAPVSDTQKSLNNLNRARQQAASGDTAGAMNSIAKADTGSVMYNALNRASREFGKAGMSSASNEIKKVLPAMQAASDETRAIKTGSAFDPRRQRTESATAGPDKCWPGYAPGAQSGVKTKAGTGKNKGKRVNNCEPTGKKK